MEPTLYLVDMDNIPCWQILYLHWCRISFINRSSNSCWYRKPKLCWLDEADASNRWTQLESGSNVRLWWISARPILRVFGETIKHHETINIQMSLKKSLNSVSPRPKASRMYSEHVYNCNIYIYINFRTNPCAWFFTSNVKLSCEAAGRWGVSPWAGWCGGTLSVVLTRRLVGVNLIWLKLQSWFFSTKGITGEKNCCFNQERWDGYQSLEFWECWWLRYFNVLHKCFCIDVISGIRRQFLHLLDTSRQFFLNLRPVWAMSCCWNAGSKCCSADTLRMLRWFVYHELHYEFCCAEAMTIGRKSCT